MDAASTRAPVAGTFGSRERSSRMLPLHAVEPKLSPFLKSESAFGVLILALLSQLGTN